MLRRHLRSTLAGTSIRNAFWLLDLRSGTSVILAKIPAAFVVRDFEISGPGSEILFDRVQMKSDLALIERIHQGSADA